MSESSRPSLYETLYGNFTGGLDLHQVSGQSPVLLSVLDNMQRILNCRAGTLKHLPDYGLPDMTKILQGMPGTAHERMGTLSDAERDQVRQRRKYCLSYVRQVTPPEKLDVAEIARAAKVAQERMGLSQPDGAAFRLKDKDRMHTPDFSREAAPVVDAVIFGSELTENATLASLHGIDILAENTEGAS